LEITAAVTAIGALFLAIPTPTDNKAREALAHIQFLWLFLISLLLIVVFASLFLFAVRVEDEVKGRYKFDIESTVSMLVFVFAAMLVFRLWQYTLAVYREAMSQTMPFLSIPVGAALAAGWVYLRRRIVQPDTPTWSNLKLAIPLDILFALTLSVWIELVDLQFSLSAWLRGAALYVVSLLFSNCWASL
jgi:hypothetical protein